MKQWSSIETSSITKTNATNMIYMLSWECFWLPQAPAKHTNKCEDWTEQSREKDEEKGEGTWLARTWRFYTLSNNMSNRLKIFVVASPNSCHAICHATKRTNIRSLCFCLFIFTLIFSIVCPIRWLFLCYCVYISHERSSVCCIWLYHKACNKETSSAERKVMRNAVTEISRIHTNNKSNFQFHVFSANICELFHSVLSSDDDYCIKHIKTLPRPARGENSKLFNHLSKFFSS